MGKHDELITRLEAGSQVETDCPRCHETCGWCGDYRHMHGQLTLPGAPRRYCTVPDLYPEGDNCPVCHGAKRVLMVKSYSPLSREAGHGG